MKKTILLLATIIMSYSSYAQDIIFDNLKSTDGYGKTLEFGNYDTRSGISAYRFINQNNLKSNGPVLTLQAKSESPIKPGWKNRVTFNNDKLGIGILNPQYTLDVNGTSQTNNLIINPPNGGRFLQMGQDIGSGQRLFNFGSSDNFSGYSFYNTDGTLRLNFYSKLNSTWLGLKDENEAEIFKVAKSPGIGSFLHLPQVNSRIVIGGFGNYLLNDGYKFIIKGGSGLIEGNLIASGNVGIGTSNPDAKLAVKGRIHAEEVKVDLNVPADYVFDVYYTGASKLKEDYTMPTLKEVEAFTKKNHHLPAIPSAKKIQEEGLNVSEMTNLLLQKIEELTLYTIEQEKRIEALEAKKIQKK